MNNKGYSHLVVNWPEILSLRKPTALAKRFLKASFRLFNNNPNTKAGHRRREPTKRTADLRISLNLKYREAAPK